VLGNSDLLLIREKCRPVWYMKTDKSRELEAYEFEKFLKYKVLHL